MTGLSIITLWASFHFALSGDSIMFQPLVHAKPGYHMEIFQKCYQEATYPMDSALGNFFQYSYMCSEVYYQACKQELPLALVNKTGLQPYQRDYIMSTLMSWVDGGGTFLCNMGYQSIRNLMERRGGYACTREFFPAEIRSCDASLATLRSGYEYSVEYCRTLDSDLQCYMDIICKCHNEELERFYREFFQSVLWSSPCKGISKFTSSATTSGVVAYIIVLSVLVSLLLARSNY